MEILYLTSVKLYSLLINLASPFNKKAGEWVKGRRNWKGKIRNTLKSGEKRIWFHCASLGEFEQGKPVLEAVRHNFPDFKIVLTFFSPSGYEIRKNEPLADYVFYLPADGPLNSPAFVRMIDPALAFFVKYEFWHYYFKALKNQNIPFYLVSAIFRPSQIFFQPYGGFFYKMLKRVSHIFVQNQSSLELLYNNSIAHVTVTGDTRFDRVYQNSIDAKNLPEIGRFKGDKKLIVAGSTWPADEKLLTSLFEKFKNDFRLVIAPHETSEARVERIVKQYGNEALRYSTWNKQDFGHSVLVIDNIGMLSSIYRYADVAYIGGGFGSGIHNILEAVVFGIPAFFGPNYKKFREAVELIHWKGAFTVKSESELIYSFEDVMDSKERIAKIHDVNIRYIDNNKGSTSLIINYLKINHPFLSGDT